MLTLADRVRQRIEIPEWGGDFWIYSLNPKDLKQIKNLQGPDPLPWLIVLSLYDTDGNRIFSPKDIPALRQKSFQVMARLAGEIVALNNGFIDQVRYKAGLDKGRAK